MNPLACAFALCAGLVLYTFLGYPLLIALAARFRPRPVRGRPDAPPTPVSIVLAAYNEEAFIDRRVRGLARLLAARPGGGELIVVSDGSTDRTVEQALAATGDLTSGDAGGISIRVHALPVNRGKAVALNEGVAVSRYPFVFFADARQEWAPDAVDRLVENFADPAVGAAGGELVLESAPGVMAGVGVYWRFEKWLRRNESRYRSMVSITGCISGVRRTLFRPIPAGILLDDMYWPLVIAMDGYRVIHDERAKAYDRLPEKTRDEFRRKVRTLAGNFQLMSFLPSSLWPRGNPVWWQFISHKALRLAMPWALLALLAISLVEGSALFRLFLVGQGVFYAVGAAGLWRPVACRSRVASAVASFLVLNLAAWMAFWVWASGRSSRSWAKVDYTASSPARSRSRMPAEGESPAPAASALEG